MLNDAGLKKPPMYDIMKRVKLKFVYLIGLESDHSYIYKRHPVRSLKNDRDDYMFCENCKNWAWETSATTMRCVRGLKD